MASNHDISSLRSEIEHSLAHGDWNAAAFQLRNLWRYEKSTATAAFVVSRFEKLRDKIPLPPCRVAILRSFTVEPVVPVLRAEALCAGIDLSVHIGDFNAYAQEILDSESSLYRFSPDVVILATQTADIAPDLWQDFSQLSEDAIQPAVDRVSGSMKQWMREFRGRSQASLVVHNLELPAQPALGVLDSQLKTSQSEVIQQVNQRIRRAARELRGVYVLDYDALVGRHGRLRWRDKRKWLMARLPVAADNLIHLARKWMRFVVPLSGKTAKVLVVDLDNTLWGGVIGEDGMTGIKLGSEYPGAAYQALQWAMLDLSR
jgi:predicted enzyme involved in methoxymalonyl-ACP biosynthesis